MRTVSIVCVLGIVWACCGAARGAEPFPQEPNTWVKRSPLPGGPSSPRMGYEASLGYDPVARRVIRWGGHNQGGGGEQNGETWTFDPLTAKWELKEPNSAPPGVCCAQQNVFEPLHNRFLRLAAFSGNHGWQWYREIYLSNAAVWAYDLSSNTWRDRRPVPSPRTHPLRCASWDSRFQVAVIFGGEGSNEGTLVYDPHTNEFTRMKPAREPEGRSGGNMCYDVAHGKHVMFGSQFSDDPRTWLYDLATNTWQSVTPDVQPPTNKNDAVLAYDQASGKVIAVVQVADELEGDEIKKGHVETWAFDAAEGKWAKVNPAKEPDGFGNRRRIMTAVPELGVVLLENYTRPNESPGVEREQQIWTYRYGSDKTGDRQRSHDLRIAVTTADNGNVLTWKPAPVSEQVDVLRGEGETPWQAGAKLQKIGVVELKEGAYRDSTAKRGEVHYYALAGKRDAQFSGTTGLVSNRPRIVEDVLCSVVSAQSIRLEWKKPAEEDIAGYHVERAVVEVFTEEQIKRLRTDTPPLAEASVGGIRAIGPFQKLTEEPLAATTFTDRSIDLTKRATVDEDPLFRHRFGKDQLEEGAQPYRFGVYAYRIRAVNRHGVVGGPSAYVLTIPSAPQHLFSREAGTACDLKWSANTEEKLAGYRVYRMNGPKKNGPGQPVVRLTIDPISVTEFRDAEAGPETKRYWIVAVDALGQEGIPSAPTWHQREFKAFYKPFTSEWHQ